MKVKEAKKIIKLNERTLLYSFFFLVLMSIIPFFEILTWILPNIKLTFNKKQ